MAENIIGRTTQELIDIWIESERNGTEFSVDFSGMPNIAFLFAIGALSEINKRSRSANSKEDFCFLRRLIGALERWRRDTALSDALCHHSLIEMADAVEMSIHHSYKIFESSGRTTKGCVYFVLNPATGLVKIGWSINLYDRVKALENQSGVTFRLLGFVQAESMKAETEFHRRFKSLRVKGEWFRYEGVLKTFVRKNFPKSKFSI